MLRGAEEFKAVLGFPRFTMLGNRKTRDSALAKKAPRLRESSIAHRILRSKIRPEPPLFNIMLRGAK